MVEHGENSYLKLKNTIDEKYKSLFLDIINEIRDVYQTNMRKILGDNYMVYTSSYNEIYNKIKEKRTNFLSSNEFLTKKRELSALKRILDNSKKEDYDENKANFDLKLSEIATLNIKLNNSLKDEMSLEKELLTKLKNLFDLKREEVISYKSQIELDLSTKIKDFLKAYKSEIQEISAVFNEKFNDNSLPFDLSILSGKGILNKFEIDYFTSDLSNNQNRDTKIEIVKVDDDVETYVSVDYDKNIN